VLVQGKPQEPADWQAIRLTGAEASGALVKTMSYARGDPPAIASHGRVF